MTLHTPNALLNLLVDQATWQADPVLALRLVDPDGAELPAWQPGAHVDVHLPSGFIRQFSLCGDPADVTAYTIAVYREPNGRGGSREIHESQLVGKRLAVSFPRQRFPLVDAPSYLFLAGGIGITPIVPMVQYVQQSGRPWRLVYGGRTLKSMAFVHRFQDCPTNRVRLLSQEIDGLPDLAAEINQADPDAAIYCCGPEPMIHEAERCCSAAKPTRSLHSERFTTKAAERAITGRDRSFLVELRRSNRIVEVPPNLSVLQAVREVLPHVPSSCEEGSCGTCETAVLAGTVEHRDSVLSEHERIQGRSMMICVSRATGDRLILDL